MLISKSIKLFIYQRDTVIKYKFTTSHRDDMYDIIENLWSQHLDVWQNDLVIEETQLNVNKPISLNLWSVEKSNIIKKYHKIFYVDDIPLDYIECTLHMNEMLKKIKLYISENALSIEAEGMKCVIPYGYIKNISIANKNMMINVIDGRQFNFMDCPAHFYDICCRQREKLSLEEQSVHEISDIPDGYTYDVDYLNHKEYAQNQSALKLKWDQYFNVYGKTPSMIQTDTFESLLRIGVPDIYRRVVWQLSCGSTYLFESNKGVYSSYLKDTTVKNSVVNEIDKDVNRSLPTHPFYQNHDSIVKIRRILIAYASRNPAIGYCQGMNTIASIFLLYMTEEEAFWVLVTIVEKISPHYYNKHLSGTIVDQKIFWNMVSKRNKKVYQILKKIGLPLNTLTLSWFICFYQDRVPWNVMLRIIDLFLYYGTSVLFQVGLGLFQILEETILKEKYSDMIPSIIKNKPITNDEANLLLSIMVDTQRIPIRLVRYKYRVKMLKKMQRKKGMKTIQDLMKNYPTWEFHDIEEIYNLYIELGKGNSLSMDQFRALIGYYYPHIHRLMYPEKNVKESNFVNHDLESMYQSLVSGVPTTYQSEKSRYVHIVSNALPLSSMQEMIYDVHESNYFLYNSNDDHVEYWSHYKGKEFVDKIYSYYCDDKDRFMDFKNVMEVCHQLISKETKELFEFCKNIILVNEHQCSVHQLYEIFLVLYHLTSTEDYEDQDDIHTDLRDFAKSIFEINNVSMHDGHEFTRMNIEKVDDTLCNYPAVKGKFEKIFIQKNEHVQ